MPATGRLCPICNRPVSEDEAQRRFRPFCSKRCADIDLGRWLKGGYAIPATETEDESEEDGEGSTPGDRGSADRALRAALEQRPVIHARVLAL